jgi:VIT1/CCC1 family predicted Fe2+/Mn2+ transporter
MSAHSSDWRAIAERERRNKAQYLRKDAIRRLRRMERNALERLALEGPSVDPTARVVLDSERYAAPLAERLGPRERVQVLLWASLAIVGAVALVSFFSAPLMDEGTAIVAVLVATMLALSHLL